MILNEDCSSKSAFVEYNSARIPKITPVSWHDLKIRIPSPDKVFHFERVKNIVKDDKGKMKLEEHTKVTLNGELLEGLSQHMPVDYSLLEINESGTRVVAKVHDGNRYALFAYDLENNRHWYVYDISRSIIGIYFLDDQNLLLCFESKKYIDGEEDKIFSITIILVSCRLLHQILKYKIVKVSTFPFFLFQTIHL